jgi:L-lactate dehydrogenase complex protein LldG
MSAAREEILRRIRGALTDVPRDEAAEAVPRTYRHTDDRGAASQAEEFVDRLSDYGARVVQVTVDDVGRGVVAACAECGLTRLAVPPAVPAAWRPHGIELIEDHGLSTAELDAVDGALTGCAVAIAQTGTLLLDGRGVSGRRPLTLIPDHHLCVVSLDQLVGLVPEGLAAVADAVATEAAPVTMISGPSASSDIELTRVEGMHGPRTLVVVLVMP